MDVSFFVLIFRTIRPNLLFIIINFLNLLSEFIIILYFFTLHICRLDTCFAQNERINNIREDNG